MDLRSAKKRNPQGSVAGWNVGTETEDAVQVTQWLLWVPRPGLPRGASLHGGAADSALRHAFMESCLGWVDGQDTGRLCTSTRPAHSQWLTSAEAWTPLPQWETILWYHSHSWGPWGAGVRQRLNLHRGMASSAFSQLIACLPPQPEARGWALAPYFELEDGRDKAPSCQAY